MVTVFALGRTIAFAVSDNAPEATLRLDAANLVASVPGLAPQLAVRPVTFRGIRPRISASRIWRS